MNRRLLVLYPRAWRDRYGDEVVTLAEDLVEAGETTPGRAALGLIAGAAAERWRSRPRGLIGAVPVLAGLLAMVVRAHPKPYFATRPAGLLLLAAEAVWAVLEISEWRRGRQFRRADAAQRQFRFSVGACAVAVTAAVNLAPALVPAARIRPGAAAFTAGLLVLGAGIALRAWSFAALRGRYLNFSVAVAVNAGRLTAGPYRLVRHPGHAGVLQICAGFGLASANGAGLAVMVLLPLAFVLKRIPAEEVLLRASIGDSYARYARDHKRLLPRIW